jgi:hypothetical protein
MSELINQLIYLLEKFNDLGGKAESKLSKTGEQDRKRWGFTCVFRFLA